MLRFIGLALAISLVIFPLMCYTYVRGCKDGVVYYQHSHRFELALQAMYRFGFMDGVDSCKNHTRGGK